MVPIDANILAYLTIQGDCSSLARKLLLQDDDWHSESSVMVELTNVLTTAIRHGQLEFEQGEIVLQRAEMLLSETLHTIPHLEVLKTALEFKISSYDARYIALARELNVPLVTEDKKLRAAAPDWTVSLEDSVRI